MKPEDYFPKTLAVRTRHVNAAGQLHRDGGPALIFADGTEVWYRDGVMHRDGDEPAIVSGDGSLRVWVSNGELHRLAGPAVVRGDDEEWFFRGQRHRDGGGPAVVWPSRRERRWYWRGKLHRDDGPAVIVLGRHVKFCKRGRLHRHGGPAVIYANGQLRWFKSARALSTGGSPAFRDGVEVSDMIPMPTYEAAEAAARALCVAPQCFTSIDDLLARAARAALPPGCPPSPRGCSKEILPPWEGCGEQASL